jgi:hypothetical protein
MKCRHMRIYPEKFLFAARISFQCHIGGCIQQRRQYMYSIFYDILMFFALLL